MRFCILHDTDSNYLPTNMNMFRALALAAILAVAHAADQPHTRNELDAVDALLAKITKGVKTAGRGGCRCRLTPGFRS